MGIIAADFTPNADTVAIAMQRPIPIPISMLIMEVPNTIETATVTTVVSANMSAYDTDTAARASRHETATTAAKLLTCPVNVLPLLTACDY